MNNSSKKRTKFKSGTEVDTFISVFKLKNSMKDNDFEGEEDEDLQCQYKVIVFHCLNTDHQMQLVRKT